MIENNKINSKDVITKFDCIVFAGFINAHTHQYGLLSHGIPQTGKVTDFETFLLNYWWPFIENRITKEEVLTTAKASMGEMIFSGITSFCDILEAPNTEEDTLIAQGELIEKVGMRAIVSLESSERISLENGNKCLRQNEESVKHFRKLNGLVKGAICTHTTFTCSEDFIKKAVNLANKNDAILQFHLSESKYEPEFLLKKSNEKPVKLYERINGLSENIIATQCVKIDEEEIEILKKNKVKTVHMPISNCEVGGGFAPIPEMLSFGLETGLGTDGYINDFFAVMKATFLIHKANKETTEVMSAEQVFQMATEYGAKVMGLDNVGTLEKGMKADFVIYQDNHYTPITRDNLLDQLVVHGQKENVTDLFVNGNQLLKNRHLTTLDEDTIWKDMKICAEKFWREIQENENDII